MPKRLATFVFSGVAVLAIANVTLASRPASAFSRIDPADGSGTGESKEGIISVPLPPIPSATSPEDDGPDAAPDRGTTPQPEGTDAGEVPLSPEDEEGMGKDGDADTRYRAPQAEQPSAESNAPAAPPRQDGGQKPATTGAGTPYRSSGDQPAAVPLPSSIAYGEDGLPQPVRDLRRKLIEVARTGDIERLRPYLQSGEDGTVLSFGEAAGDPITFLKSASGDGKGIEMLAILLEVLNAGHAHVEPGDTDEEIYVWPYFTQVPIDRLTEPQMVELFELVTAGDYESMKEFGAYNFYRLGISPEGKLEFFVAGD